MDRSIKQQVKALLLQRDYGRLLDLCERDRGFWKALRFCLYEIDESQRWPAIEAVAKLMQRWWQAGRGERVREYIRSLFWLLNDESGGIGWNAPQTIAEIIVAIPQLLEPYGGMMIAHTFEEPPLVKGALWGIGRLGKQIKEAVEFSQDVVLEAFESRDPETLGLAAWAMGEVGFAPALPFLEFLKDRGEPVQIYIEGDFYERPLGQWAKDAINKIRHQGLGHDLG